jgi:hypothetical protein
MEMRQSVSLGNRQLVVGLRWIYAIVAWLVSGCILAQVFLAGMNVFLQPLWWSYHISLGHWTGPLIISLLLLSLAARLPLRLRWLSALLLLLFGLQYNFRTLAGLADVPALAALHAVNALLLFWLATTLGRHAWRIARRGATE